MSNWRRYSIRFAVVGIASNILIYLLFLVLTFLGVGYKVAMSSGYFLAFMQTFSLNKIWTFGHCDEMYTALGRYLITYALGYVINLGMLYFFVDRLGGTPLLVQGLAIPCVALVMFLLQRHWVFANTNPAPGN